MATRYHELVVEGPKGWAHGFVQGFLRGRKAAARVYDAEDEGFECESFREQIRELLHPASDIRHLIVPEPVCALVREAVDLGAELGHTMAVRLSRPLVGARFEFSFSVYSRQHAARIRSQFESLPEGVRLTAGTRLEEIGKPGPKTLQMYAPVHDFELRAAGGVEGHFEGILALYRTCLHDELIRTREARLIGESPPAGGKGEGPGAPGASSP